jgi:hypothetical protein
MQGWRGGSPILADRFAAKVSEGVSAVATQLRSALDAATRAVGLAARSPASERLDAFGRDLKARADAETRLRTTEGVEQIKAAFELLLDQLESALKSPDSAALNFNIKRKKGDLTAHTRAKHSVLSYCA